MAVLAARRHYLFGDSKIDIGRRLGINRFKVARLLEAAREAGLVKIDIMSPGIVDLDLSASVKEHCGFDHCAVVAGSGASTTVDRAALGRVAAELLQEILSDGDVLGLPWSQSTMAMSQCLDTLPSVDVVQLSGAVEMPGVNATAVDIVRTTARASGGVSHIFHAPFILDDPQAAQSLRRQATVAQALAATATLTHAVLGVGAWTAENSSIYSLTTLPEREAMARAGVIGELAGIFFDAHGASVHTALTDRLITVSADQIRATPHVVALAAGRARAEAVLAAAQGGLITSLVADSTLARQLLEAPESRPLPRRTLPRSPTPQAGTADG